MGQFYADFGHVLFFEEKIPEDVDEKRICIKPTLGSGWWGELSHTLFPKLGSEVHGKPIRENRNSSTVIVLSSDWVQRYI